MNNNWEEILILAGEGGRITLWGLKRPDGSWIFSRKTNEAALADILEDEDLSSIVEQQSGIVSGWEQAKELLGEALFYLSPRYVHPEFRQLVWREVSTQEDCDYMHKWKRLCLTSDNRGGWGFNI